jgi:hypothetical protein
MQTAKHCNIDMEPRKSILKASFVIYTTQTNTEL